MTAVAEFDRDSESTAGARPEPRAPKAGTRAEARSSAPGSRPEGRAAKRAARAEARGSSAGTAEPQPGVVPASKDAPASAPEARPASPAPSSASPAPSSASPAPSSASPAPSEDQLLDVLYEVLAHGVPERSTLTREHVEQLLHEHAREPKPLEELLLFFETHDLPFDASAYGADRELGELASGLLRQRTSLLTGFAVPDGPEPALPVPMLGSGPLPALPHENDPTGRLEVEARERALQAALAAQGSAAKAALGRMRRLAWVGACAALGLLGAFVYSQWQSWTLQQSLQQAHMQQLSTDAALTKLEQRAEQLTSELKQSEDERRGLNAHFDAILQEEANKRASEEEALERLLGGRYRKLRAKLAEEAAIAAP